MIQVSDRTAYACIAALSLGLLGFLFWLLLLHQVEAQALPGWVRALPALNAGFNFSSACLLLAGYFQIRKGRRESHMAFMLAALAMTLAFLISYVTYHHYAGDTKFGGQGWIRPAYFFILITHVLLSMLTTPLVLAVLFFAATGRFDRHRKLARATLGMWLYVSVTGVAVYFLLRPYH